MRAAFYRLAPITRTHRDPERPCPLLWVLSALWGLDRLAYSLIAADIEGTRLDGIGRGKP